MAVCQFQRTTGKNQSEESCVTSQHKFCTGLYNNRALFASPLPPRYCDQANLLRILSGSMLRCCWFVLRFPAVMGVACGSYNRSGVPSSPLTSNREGRRGLGKEIPTERNEPICNVVSALHYLITIINSIHLLIMVACRRHESRRLAMTFGTKLWLFALSLANIGILKLPYLSSILQP